MASAKRCRLDGNANFISLKINCREYYSAGINICTVRIAEPAHK